LENVGDFHFSSPSSLQLSPATSSKHLSPYLWYIVHVSCTSPNSHSTCLKSDTEIICLSKDKLLTLHIGSCARISHNSATVAEHESPKRK